MPGRGGSAPTRRLQALLTMNDPQYFEAARHLGYRMLREGGPAEADRLRLGFRLVTARLPTSAEANFAVLTNLASPARPICGRRRGGKEGRRPSANRRLRRCARRRNWRPTRWWRICC